MADFCKQCSEELFGEDFGDLDGLCKVGECVGVLCEGCGPTTVSCSGTCEGNCMKPHHNRSRVEE